MDASPRGRASCWRSHRRQGRSQDASPATPRARGRNDGRTRQTPTLGRTNIMGLRSQLGWIRHGAVRTTAALDSYGIELRELQEKVEALTAVVARLDVSVARIESEAAAD